MLPRDPSSAPIFGGPKDLANAIRDLQKVFSGDRNTTDEEDLIIHGSSSWFPMHNEGCPNIVVYPQTTSEIQEIARIATRYKVPVICYGAGTAIEGQFSPPYGGICVDFGRMNSILDIQEDDMTVTVQPGISWQDLNRILEEKGTRLFFPVDPGPGASIGGSLATSSSGPNAARYGTMKSWVVSCKVVTIDGEVFDTRCKAKKSSTGYDLNHLMIGSEGTLGLVSEITLRLTNIPEVVAVGTCAFPDVSEVTQVVLKAIKQGLRPQCLELLDKGNMPAINAYGDGFKFPPVPHLFFKLSGSKSNVEEETAAMRQLCEQHGKGFSIAKSAKEADQIWGARKNLLLASLAQHQDCSALSTDVCVPLSKLPGLVTEYRRMSEERGIVSSILGHVADGNFHSLILYKEEDAESVAKAKKLSADLLKLSLSLGGTVSGEHGVGSTKRGYMIAEYGVVGIDLMMRIKDAWDPHGLLNPGKLLPDRRDLVKARRHSAALQKERS